MERVKRPIRQKRRPIRLVNLSVRPVGQYGIGSEVDQNPITQALTGQARIIQDQALTGSQARIIQVLTGQAHAIQDLIIQVLVGQARIIQDQILTGGQAHIIQDQVLTGGQVRTTQDLRVVDNYEQLYHLDI